MRNVRWVVGMVAVIVLLAGARPELSEAEKPNFIIIFADDQGYRDLGCFGSPDIKTPNIDRLAEEGMRLTDFYSAYCVCSASRASLMTGSYQPRLCMPGVLWPNGNAGLHPDEVTIADMLRTKGYATACVGKWHLGDHPETLPTAQGFDGYLGIPYSNDMAQVEGVKTDPDSLDEIWREKKWDVFRTGLYDGEKKVECPANQVTLTDRYTERAVSFIREQGGKKNPFFLYMPHSMPHIPLFVSDDRFDSDPQKAYKLTIEHMDASVGAICRALEETGAAENTFIIYTSDNGPWLPKKHHGGSALPLRAGKGTTWEGGMRVPCVMRWPSRIKPGGTCSRVAGTIDLIATFAKIVGADLPADRPIDGRDMGAVLDDPNAASPHAGEGYYYYKAGKLEAVRVGKWKLHFKDDPELYDLEADMGEVNNLAGTEKEQVARLQKIADRYDADLRANVRPCWRKKK